MSLRLDPAFEQAMRPLLARIPPRLLQIDPADFEKRRGISEKLSEIFKDESPLPNDVDMTEWAASADDGHPVPIYRFSKKENTTAATGMSASAIVHIHGGGMVSGHVKDAERSLVQQVSATGVQIFSVEYRLAPEHRHPILVEDCWTALTWLHQEAERFGVDRARIAVMGESAGGGIAAGLALLARDRGLSPPLAKQILICPMLDDRNIIPDLAIESFAMWKAADNAAGWAALLGVAYGTEQVSPYAAPARALSLAGLPGTYLDTGGLDIFRNENIQYAMRLVVANVPVELHLYPGVPHGFEGASKDISVTRRALENRREAMVSF